MSVRDTIKTSIRKVLASDMLGESISYETAKSSRASRGKAFEAAGTLTGSLVELASAIVTEGNGDIEDRSAILRVDDTDTELDIGDRVTKDSVVWAVVEKSRQEGHISYGLRGIDVLRTGVDR